VIWFRRLLVVIVALVGLWGVVGNVMKGMTIDDIALLPASLAFTVVGFVLIVRVPHNLVSWLVFAVGASSSVLGAIETYASVEVAEFAAGVFIFGILVPGVGVMLPLVFPTGKPLSGGWRWVGRLCLGAVGVMFAGFFLQAIFESNRTSDVGCEGTGSCMALYGLFFVLACAVLAVASFIMRWRRSTGIEREQLRWLVLPFIALVVALVLEFGGLDDSSLVLVFLGLGLFLIPLSIGVAVTRYRLYEIDRIISRTLAYLVVVGILGLVFALGVVAVPNLVIGTGSAPPLVVAGSTLAVAALFNPVRRRVSRWVDRRFNRNRYDSEVVVERFALRLRDEVDPDQLVAGWADVAAETMQPAVMGVWVRQ
jgi:hypothetical protein